MKLKKDNLEQKQGINRIILGLFILVPIILIIIIVMCRKVVVPSNEQIVDSLNSVKYYTCTAEYIFNNSKGNFEEETVQYFNSDKGMRIEFKDDLQRIKVYKGDEIELKTNTDECMLDKDIDVIYPLASLKNIFSNIDEQNIEEIKLEWSDDIYLKLNLKYNFKNKHIFRGEFYINKQKKSPSLLKVYDDNGKERILVKYKDFNVKEKLEDDLF